LCTVYVSCMKLTHGNGSVSLYIISRVQLTNYCNDFDDIYMV